MKKEKIITRYGIAASYIAVSAVSLAFFWGLSLTGYAPFVSIFTAYSYIFPLVFSIAIATGIGFDHSGASALAGAVGYLVFGASFSVLIDPKSSFLVTAPIKLFGSMGSDQVFFIICGLVMGLVAGFLYNKFYNIKMPEWLAFFGGRRFVPIITSITALFIGSFVANIIIPHL
ncbi:PTS transporter subunit EIIC [Carnobacterium gallinarum]|uniref:PTS transporter subunit EIIC n=1 Tax=Carnobacterium gallinarum TaxID=2749 RepID=UPI000558248C|nr:PTS transporter subunit EIIC [Carnobacterium gallinarum]